jgi:hypothetical protein
MYGGQANYSAAILLIQMPPSREVTSEEYYTSYFARVCAKALFVNVYGLNSWGQNLIMQTR